MVTALQVLGQTALGFNVSIAQVLITVAAGGMIELVYICGRRGRLVWPASGLLAGNGVAFILRAGGTRHGDWWSLNGIGWFLMAVVLALGSKYLLRSGGRHVFNPANFGLVLCLLLVGSPSVYPQYLWWGPMGPAVGAAWVVILLGAAWVLRPLRMLPMAGAFLLTMGVAVALLAASGRCFDAVWRSDSVCGLNYWIGIALSPELAVFALFMMSDPRTAPPGQRGRLAFGVATAAVAAILLAQQPTEYGVKVAILAALLVALMVVRVVDSPRAAGVSVLVGALVAAISAVLVVGLASNQELVRLERGGGGDLFGGHGRGQGMRRPAASEPAVEQLRGAMAWPGADRAGPRIADAVVEVEISDNPARDHPGPPEHPSRRFLST